MFILYILYDTRFQHIWYLMHPEFLIQGVTHSLGRFSDIVGDIVGDMLGDIVGDMVVIRSRW